MKSMVASETDPNVNPPFQKEADYSYHDTMILCTISSQEYMNLSLHFLDKNLLHVSLLLCNRALESMLNALYIKKERRRPTSNIVLDDILRMFSKHSGLNVESLIFIQTISYLSHESSLISKIQPTYLMNLIKRADALLLQIASQLELHYKTYHSVFEK
ncbi:hypothetical protein M2277_003381 [Paenibacillus sp. LBL]|uniref:hypothetical protein n=1 Tax=Paenibacillus sp. LBL TaxID=2940563 RepID=UPI002474EA82|nr:hypothetical protein [Paenibacillus sp. LBL]MDH6672719.1 hypothetical protein [Paenibacillus sp. LBL]